MSIPSTSTPRGAQASPPRQVEGLPPAVRLLQRVMGEVAATAGVVMCALGVRLGVFRSLLRDGPATAEELADRTGLQVRYLQELLLALGSGGYLDLEPDGRRFRVPEDVAPVLADASSDLFAGDLVRLLPALAAVSDPVALRFRTGAGLAADEYPTELFEAIWQKNDLRMAKALVPQWLAGLDGLCERLARGGRVTHLFCQDARALVTLAQAFPAARLTGCERSGRHLDRARSLVEDHGVADRVDLYPSDGQPEIPPDQDLVLVLDTLHESPDPLDLLRRIRAALAPEGVLLLLASNGEDVPLAEKGPVSTLLYAISTLQGVPQGLTETPAPVSMMGLSERVLVRMCGQAGLSSVRAVTHPSPFNTLYEVHR